MSERTRLNAMRRTALQESEGVHSRVAEMLLHQEMQRKNVFDSVIVVLSRMPREVRVSRLPLRLILASSRYT
jgi:hypothetical protein